MSSPASAAASAEEPAGGDWKGKVLKGLAIYIGLNAVSNFLLPKPSSSQAPSAQDGVPPAASQQSAAPPSFLDKLGAQSAQKPVLTPPSLRVLQNASARPIWPPTSKLDFYVFLSHGPAPSQDDLGTQISALAYGSHPAPSLDQVVSFDAYPSLTEAAPVAAAPDGAETPPAYTIVPAHDGTSLPVIKFSALSLNDPRLKAGLTADVELTTPGQVMGNNGSIWADIVAVGSGVDVRTSEYKARTRKMLTRLYPARKNREGRRLLGGGAATAEDDEGQAGAAADPKGSHAPVDADESKRIISYWHRNLTLGIAEQQAGATLPVGSLPPPIVQHVHLVRNADGSLLHPEAVDNRVRPDLVFNYPVVWANTFWDLREDMFPVNATTPTLPLHVNLYLTSWFKFQLQAALGESFEKQPGMAGGEIDIIKHTLMTTSPWYLGLTLVVTLLHSLFEFLAFSSEVKFWKKKDNFSGVSLGSIVTSIVTQTIILLYLVDSSEETSWMILGSQAVGVVVEAWKLTKAVTISVQPSLPGSLLPYRLVVADKHVATEEELQTKQYDRQAFRIVAYIAVPLLGGYTVYSALYNEHRGWWSFTIGTLTSFVYAFGFIALIPQLIVNHKMKSVAGLPPKTLIFKILNTFVDDLFAFGVVKMPLLHRLATLRDDVVFAVYLYQWYIYGIDRSRPNEFGQVLDPDARKALEAKEAGEAKEAKEAVDVKEGKKDR
ncbi:unnamed protein product [Parajaminaea phylloscopi]